jgi:adhesin transport system membrane fusion protein
MSARHRIEETRLQFRREVQVQLGEAEVSIARADEQMAEATHQQERTTLTSPITGVIKDLAVQSVGDVVHPGDVIMQVVPIADQLVIEARLAPRDLGFVVVGMPATVKFTAFEFALFGGLEGLLTYIAPYTNKDEDGEVYTLVIIETERSYLGNTDNPRQITAGMQATAEILTGTRSVLQYLIRPIQKAREGAFRER